VARAAAPSYPGSGSSGPGLPTALQGTPQAEGWIWARRSLVHLAPGIYDLRGTLAYLLQQAGAPRQQWTAQGRSSNPREVAFSRAVRALVRRAYLEPVWLVPLDAVDPLYCQEEAVPWCREEDGTASQYLLWYGHTQIRFVRWKGKG
jgi:hypothetical protein